MRMGLGLGLAVLLFSLTGNSVSAAELAGVKLEDSARLADAGPELVLNGAGIRTRAFFKVYVGALYLTEKKTDAAAVLSDPGPKRVAIHMVRDISSESLASALSDGLTANHSEAELAPLQARIKDLLAILTADKEIKTGNVIFLDYLPGIGTRVTANGQAKGTIPGEDFNRALLKVWLGEKPADASLKKGMLGG
ncbi:MAG: chalcone isomerase family protein [Betaproteobacteria bacterium]|nr:chalcone isomerase family protein [Betaproteobacteria bacterium]